MERAGVGGDDQRRQPAELTELLERGLGCGDCPPGGGDPFGHRPFPLTPPDHDDAPPQLVVQAGGDGGEAFFRPELRRPSGAGIENHRRCPRPEGRDPCLHPRPRQRPARHIELGQPGADAERGEEGAIPLDNMRGRRRDREVGDHPGALACFGAGMADADRAAGEKRDQGALQKPLQVDRDVGAEGPQVAPQTEDLRRAFRPAPRQAEDAVDCPVPLEDIGGAPLHGPANRRCRKGILDRHRHGDSMEDVADGRELHQEDRVRRVHNRKLPGNTPDSTGIRGPGQGLFPPLPRRFTPAARDGPARRSWPKPPAAGSSRRGTAATRAHPAQRDGRR